MFGIADRILIRGPRHVRDADRVMRVYLTTTPAGMREFTTAGVGQVSLDLVRRHSRSAESVAGYAIGTTVIGSGPRARTIPSGYASAGLFPLLGVRPVAGRFFTPAEDAPDAAQRVVVVSEDLWQRMLGSVPDVRGQTLNLDGEPHHVIGVAPRGFTGPELRPVDVWRPMNLIGSRITRDWRTSWNAQWMQIVVRLRDDVDIDEANAELTAIHRRGYTGEDPAEARARVWLAELGANDSGKEPANARVIRWLTAIALIVLLIAAANVVNLLLARGIRREREAAIRLALGATRGRVVRLVLIESTVLAAAGAALGLLLATVLGGIARRFLSDIAWPGPVVDHRAAVVVIVGTLVLGIMVGVVPALGIARAGLSSSLRTGGRDGRVHRGAVRRALTVAQAAMSVPLLIGAGLFVRSLWNARTVDLGVDPERVLVVELQQSGLGGFPFGMRDSERERRRQMYLRAVEALRAHPGIEQASVSVGLPFGNRFTVRLRIPGIDSIPQLPTGSPSLSAVAADYFTTVGTRIVRGRAFTAADGRGTEPVSIVSATMARVIWPNEDPIGRCLIVRADTAPCARIVGIAGDTHRSALREDPSMHYYIPFGQEVGIGGAAIVVRPRGKTDDPVLHEEIRRMVASLDASIRYVDVESIQERIDPQMRPWRIGSTVFVASGVLALLVAAVGIYSMLSYLVANRRHEFGVRIALGATRRDIAGLVMRGSMAMAALGVVVGSAVAYLAGPFVEPVLFEVKARDPLVYASTAATLLGVALLAACIPTVRANRIDPLESLRSD
jgi:predicted permease